MIIKVNVVSSCRRAIRKFMASLNNVLVKMDIGIDKAVVVGAVVNSNITIENFSQKCFKQLINLKKF